jgi:hypothetical protein
VIGMKDRKKFFLVVILVIIAISQIVSADNHKILIVVSSPEEDDVFYHDVSPAYLSVEGFIHSSNTIQKVIVKYGNESKQCGKNLGYPYTNISCSFLFNDNNDKILLTAVDDKGTIVSETRNFTSHGGIPPPDKIYVYGNITDATGRPIGGAFLAFKKTENNSSFQVNTTTDNNGKYSMKKAFGFQYTITIEKEGYQTLVKDVTFKPRVNFVDFTLSSQQSSKSSSVVLSSTLVIIVVCILLFYTVKK